MRKQNEKELGGRKIEKENEKGNGEEKWERKIMWDIYVSFLKQFFTFK